MRIELPTRQDRPLTLGVPADARVEAAMASASLLELNVRAPRFTKERWARVRDLATHVVAHLRGNEVVILVGTAANGGGIVSFSQYGASYGGLAYARCDRCASGCEHVVAAALALAWTDPAERELLQMPAWRLWAAQMGTAATAATAAEDDRPRGWIRCVLHADPTASDDQLAHGHLELQLVRTAKRGGRPLAPRPAPKSLASIERQVRDLPAGDRAICLLAEQRRLLAHATTYRYSESSRFEEAVARLDTELMARLGEATELVFEDRPVRVDKTPFAPALEATERRDGGLRLRWAEGELRAILRVGTGWALGRDDVLRPLPPDLPTGALEAIGLEPPEVPPEDVETFVEAFALRAPVPVRLHTKKLAVASGQPRPRLMLREADGALHVEARFGYGDVEVPAVGGVALMRAADGTLVERDPGAEAQALAALQALLPGTPPLKGDDALDFLFAAPQRLEGWQVFVDDSLRERKLRGTLTPRTALSSGVDWFDLHVGFGADGAEVAPAAVLASWRRGDRYHRLPDGSVVRLPRAWLARHADDLEELLDMKQGRRGRLGAFAAPLAAELLEEAAPSADRDRWRDVAARLAAVDRVPERPLPKGLRAELRPYQHHGFRWLVFLRALGLGGVLADDMGLGKTLQALALLLDTHGDRKGPPSLVVAPTSVVHNWAGEARRFAPDLRVHLHHGAGRGEVPADVDVVVTSYALLRQDAAILGRHWRYAVLDEAQHIKNPDSQIAQAARELDAEHRLALTGTPLENHLLELWSIFQFLMPGFFGSRRAFAERYANRVQREQDADALAALKRRTRPFVLRRLKREVATELPPRTEQVLYCELGPDQRRLYERVKETYRDSVLGRVAEQGVGRATIQVLEALMRLRQACCDPRLLPFDEARGVGASAKLELLRDTLGELVEEGHRALVFSQWPSLLKLVAADLEAMGVEYLYLDGSTRERGELQARWNREDGPPVFLISLKAGGTGLNLTGADHVIHLDPWWNPAVEAQATDRAHRIGQTRPVIAYKLVARDTVEEKILELQDRKRALFEATVDADRLLVDALTREDLEAVFAAEPGAPAAKGPGARAPKLALVTDAPAPPTAAAPPPTAAASPLPAAVAARLAADGRLTNASVREALACDADEARRRLAAWVEAGALVQRGARRGTHYLAP